jgi:ribonucleotide monophosphatase NagD (HAD superfamily)
MLHSRLDNNSAVNDTIYKINSMKGKSMNISEHNKIDNKRLFVLDCASICAMLTASSGRKPTYIGKPSCETLNAIMSITGYEKGQIVFVGDRLYTDIAIGVENGVTSVLVLSGEKTENDLQKSDIKPDYIFPSIRGLSEAIS